MFGAVSMLMLTQCGTSDEAQRKFEQEAFRFPSGFTRTSESGDIIEIDPDDWRVSPLYEAFVEVTPAYPNPTTGQNVNIELLITGLGAVNGLEIYFFDDRDNLRLLYFDERIPLPTGFTSLSINPIEFSESGTIAGALGLHRILIYDRRGNIITYGDIKVE